MIPAPVSGRRQALALAALVLLVGIPAAWVAFGLRAASETEALVSEQSPLLAGLKERLAAFRASPQAAAAVERASIFLPGQTVAIAGAALQKTVADAIQAAGGRVIESEFAPVESVPEDPGRVDLRVSFDTEIGGLQRILYGLETGSPVLLVRSLSVQSAPTKDLGDNVSPPLRVVVLVGAYWEAEKEGT